MERSITAFRESIASSDDSALRDLIRTNPKNAGGWYFLGVLHLRACRIREAARCFGAAYHRNCDLETAVLFTFACLKARDGRQSDIVDQLLATWNEIREQDAPRTPDDRRIAEVLAETAPTETGLSLLGRLIWSVVGPDQRQSILTILKTENGKALRESVFA
ncbi:MAG: hypothetical protein IPK83_00685 [Planctomycetes bacterium]|nr:hypothetical protein [Planctomycetota bacterium]